MPIINKDKYIEINLDFLNISKGEENESWRI